MVYYNMNGGNMNEQILKAGISVIEALKKRGIDKYPFYTFANTEEECLQACFGMALDERVTISDSFQLDTGIFMIIYTVEV